MGGGGGSSTLSVPVAPVQVPLLCLVKQYNNSSVNPFFLAGYVQSISENWPF